MGLFQQQSGDEKRWAAIPAEPRDPEAFDELAVAESVDAAAFGLGGSSAVESLIVPVPSELAPAGDDSDDEAGEAE